VLVVTAFVEEPLLVVMVIEVALVDCHVKVTLCPLAIDVEFTESVTVGTACAIFFGLLAQEQAPHKARIRVPREIVRKHGFVMCSV
jgi:hypothetical protein